ncbi:hypothetical protein GCM10025771_14810 [Niveibacterium umoris]|uniref:Uncharacterized protein n=1 Tax=Niveibacterium umoris TaxID=1193620 RepID=A0A840BPQ1_9RHOO|nr:hypothetical protein [Niveibacterium umoris]MBB4014644.1 hypothetical protein [Niveibacterium umoris]
MQIPRFSADQWQQALASQRLLFRVAQGGEVLAQGLLSDAAQLDTRIYVADLDAQTPAHFGGELLRFLESGQRAATFRCQACCTIEKFGQAIQFYADYAVRFEWQPLPDGASDASRPNAIRRLCAWLSRRRRGGDTPSVTP